MAVKRKLTTAEFLEELQHRDIESKRGILADTSRWSSVAVD